MAYSLALMATAAVGVATAPTRAVPAPSSVLSGEPLASNVLSVEPALPAMPRHAFLAASAAVSPVGAAFGQQWYERFAEPKAAVALEANPVGRGQRLSAASPLQSIAFSRRAVAAPAPQPLDAAFAEPVEARFAIRTNPLEAAAPVILAYADPSPGAAVAMLDAIGTGGDLAVASLSPAPEHAALPDSVPLPLTRPKTVRRNAEDAAGPAMAARKPAIAAEEPEPLVARKPAREPETKLAYANPDDAAGNGGGGLLRNLFGGGGGSSKAGDGVAVYDISAAKVYMPDGSVLEAHSGIGKMADDPRYVHVKMNGPTPPHTYVLKMREKRFHGVEAIRMLPINGKNKHGRDGFLTHSYLLRSRLPESHGCVAFKDYPKFLAAFKAGKVKQLVVVPGNGKRSGTRIAKNGQDA